MSEFQYKAFIFKTDIEDKLNEYLEELESNGWELVTATHYRVTYTLFCKRIKDYDHPIYGYGK
jgi:hypothetical protein